VLARDVYGALPFPESQLVALAHSLIGRGVIDEQTLAARMRRCAPDSSKAPARRS
jgi:hypothetical protein